MELFGENFPFLLSLLVALLKLPLLPILFCCLFNRMDPRIDKLVRRTTMVATVTASYFLLTADYGPEPNVLDPVKNAILSFKESIFGPKKGVQEHEVEKSAPGSSEKHQKSGG